MLTDELDGDAQLREPVVLGISGGIETIPKKLTAWPAAAAFTYPASGMTTRSK
jgi:hypothetical protein